MIKKTIFILFSLLFSYNIYAQEKKYEIFFSQCLNNDIPKDFFQGKYVVLDFWQTWCGPCIASFKDANELMAKYTTDELVFANINNETQRLKLVKDILKRKPFNGYQLIDDNNKTYKLFNVKMFPSVYILSPEGKILWRGHPVSLNELIIFDKTGIQPTVFNDDKTGKTGLYILKIHSSRKNTKASSYFKRNNKITIVKYSGYSLKNIIADLNFTSSARIITKNKRFNTQKADIYAKFSSQKNTTEDIYRIIKKKLQNYYRFRTDTVTQLSKVQTTTIANMHLLKKHKAGKKDNASKEISNQFIKYQSFALQDAFFDYEKETGMIIIANNLPEKIKNRKFNLTFPLNSNEIKNYLLKNYGIGLIEKEIKLQKIILK